MKIVVCIVCFLGIISALYAQEEKDFRRHEIKLGIGVLPLAPGMDEADYIFGYDDERYWKAVDLLDHRCYGNLYTTGDLSISYSYYFWKWFELGLNASYTRFWRSYPEGKENSVYMTLIPFIHFHWFNRPWVSMYSGGGIGWDFIRQKDSGIQKDERETNVGLQFTFYGIAVGRRLFGFAEAGVGNLGMFRWGIGYRF